MNSHCAQIPVNSTRTIIGTGLRVFYYSCYIVIFTYLVYVFAAFSLEGAT